jgi:hypothetical protein
LALQGNALALKLCLNRLSPPRRERTVNLALPAITSVDDFAAAMAHSAAATAAREMTPAEAVDLSRVADRFLHVIAARWRNRPQARGRPRRRARGSGQKGGGRLGSMSFREWLDNHFAAP